MSGDEFSLHQVPPPSSSTSGAGQASEAGSLPGVQQEESDLSLQSFIDEGAFSPAILARRFESLESRRSRRRGKEEEAEQIRKEEKVAAIQRIEKIVEEFNKKNPELQIRALLLLRSRINQNDTKESILRKVLEMYPDRWLADEALDFLLSSSEGTLAEEVRLAKEELNQENAREIRAGKNIQSDAQEFATKGLAPPPQLRALYKEVTGNPRDANTLFNELTTHFDYDTMNAVIAFLLQALGSDLKAKGSSIDHAELHRLISEARKLQAILGIFRFFKSRMPLMSSAFQKQGLSFSLSFETIAKQFMKALQERYPSADKILQLAQQLGLSEEILAQIIIFTQMRDALRQVAPRLFVSNQHKQDLLNAFMDALEELDEQLEEEEEKEEETKP